jgi:hypothetical protein
MTGVTFNCHHIPNMKFEVIAIPVKLFPAAFEANFHNIERLLPFGKLHICQPVIDV